MLFFSSPELLLQRTAKRKTHPSSLRRQDHLSPPLFPGRFVRLLSFHQPNNADRVYKTHPQCDITGTTQEWPLLCLYRRDRQHPLPFLSRVFFDEGCCSAPPNNGTDPPPPFITVLMLYLIMLINS